MQDDTSRRAARERFGLGWHLRNELGWRGRISCFNAILEGCVGWFCDSKPIFLDGVVPGRRSFVLENCYFSVGLGAIGVKPSEMACWRICSSFSGQLMGACFD